MRAKLLDLRRHLKLVLMITLHLLLNATEKVQNLRLKWSDLLSTSGEPLILNLRLKLLKIMKGCFEGNAPLPH